MHRRRFEVATLCLEALPACNSRSGRTSTTRVAMTNDQTGTAELIVRDASLDSPREALETSPTKEPVAADEVYFATRDLIGADHPGMAAAILISLVRRLGGQIVSAHAADEEALPIDISLGEGEPLLACASDPAVRARLAKYIPMVVEDARTLAEARRSLSRMARDAGIDPLTGLSNRRTLDRTLTRIGPGDTVVALDLDNFKGVNDTMGHGMGDAVLRSFARAMSKELRTNDLGARTGGDEFAFVLRRSGAEAANALLDRLNGTWRDIRPCEVAFSAGIAAVQGKGTDAMTAADRALYRAKALGKDIWCTAEDGDYPE